MNIQAIQNLNPVGLHGVQCTINNVNHVWVSLDFVDNKSANNFFSNLKRLFKINKRAIECYANVNRRYVCVNLTVLSRLEVK